MTTADGPGLVEVFRTAEREWAAEHATYRQPRWLPVLAGAWVFLYVGGLRSFDEGQRTLWILLSLVLVMGFISWERHGRPESHRTRLPKAYRTYRFVSVLLLLAFLGLLPVVLRLGDWTAAAVAGIAVGLGTWVANRVYDRATVAITEDIA